MGLSIPCIATVTSPLKCSGTWARRYNAQVDTEAALDGMMRSLGVQCDEFYSDNGKFSPGLQIVGGVTRCYNASTDKPDWSCSHEKGGTRWQRLCICYNAPAF